METMEAMDTPIDTAVQEEQQDNTQSNVLASNLLNGVTTHGASKPSQSKGKKAPRLVLLGLSFMLILLLTGCGAKGTVNADTPGFFNHYVVFPFSWLIEHFAGWYDGSYGLALITMTVLVRLVLLPFMMSQYKNQQKMKRKMKVMQPELDAIKAKYKDNKNADSMSKQQQETMALYSKHGHNPLNIGCLPMLLQLPILTGLYYAIRMTPDLAQHTFLWFQLGKTDSILPFIAAAVYLVQAKVTQAGMDPMNAQKGMGFLVYLSPIMMGVFSFSAPAAIPLYWSVGGVIVVLQTLLAKRLYPASLDTSADTSTDTREAIEAQSKKQAPRKKKTVVESSKR